MKRHALIIVTALTLASPIAPVFAADTLPSPTPLSTTPPSVEVAKRLNKLKTLGASEIDRRLDGLQKALDKANGMSKLPAGDKTKVAGELKAEITALTSIKSHLSSTTDLTKARGDIEKLVDDYQSYGLILPKGRLISSIDRFFAAHDTLVILQAQFARRINFASSQNKDTSQLEQQFESFKKHLLAAEVKYATLDKQIMDIDMDKYVEAHKALTDASVTLSSARTDMSVVRTDAKKILAGLNNLKPAAAPSSKETPEPSADPEASVSPSPAASGSPSPSGSPSASVSPSPSSIPTVSGN